MILTATTFLLVPPPCVAARPASASPIVSFDRGRLLADLRTTDWEYLAQEPQGQAKTGWLNLAAMKRDAERAKADYAGIARMEGWKPIRVGHRFETIGHAELNDQITWLRIAFQAPEQMQGERIGLFCTAADDTADVFLNGVHVARKTYVWGARVAEPIDVDLTGQIRFGGDNLLMIRINDSAQARGGGLVGHAFLYRTLPYTRTPRGGIAMASGLSGRFSVVLHLGEALLARGSQTTFTAEQLQAMEIPPYILRDDELILVTQAETAAKLTPPHRVQLDEVSPTRDARPLAVGCSRVPAQIERFELISLPIELAATYDNPFDPRQINVQAEVETPSGKTEQVAVFFSQDFRSVAIGQDEEILLPKRSDPWRWHYRPQQVGRHKFHVIAQDRSGMRRTPDQTFEVTVSSRKGFLRVSKDDPRFFEFDNGESYFGIGPSGWFRNVDYIFGGNPRWVSTQRLDEYYRRKAKAGSNYDYCLAEFFGRLYLRGGYIDQHVAWKCEHRVRLLEELGIYWVTCYDDLCRSIIYGLDTLPYSAAQGGPCRSVAELYFDEQALAMQRDHLRYFVARMSDSPALLLWAIGDEGQAGAGFSVTMTRSWIKGLHNYVRNIDIYQHPHAVGEGPRSIAEGGNTIIIPDWYFHKDVDAVTLSLEIDRQYGQFNCPLVNPEGGMVEWTKPDDHLGPKRAHYYLSGERWKFPEAISFHNHLWISLFLKHAVGGTEWLGQFIDAKNELYHATAIKKYLDGESLTKRHWETTPTAVSLPDLRGFCLRGDARSFAWVQNRFYTWLEAGHRGKTPPTLTDATIDIPVKQDGTYRIEFWDTRRGEVTGTTSVRSAAGIVRCSLPPIQKDVALKAVLVESGNTLH